jgi:hypothetical protein
MPRQVLVGAGLGAATAAAWFQAGAAWALPALQQSKAGLTVLSVATCLASAAFGGKIVASWFKDRRRRRKQQKDEAGAAEQQQQQELQQLLGSTAQPPPNAAYG